MARQRRITGASGEKLLAWPPSSFEPVDPVSETLGRGQRLLRIYSPEPYDTGPLTFREFGPLNRFDHHRSGDGPKVD
jgi:hypothetical protein